MARTAPMIVVNMRTRSRRVMFVLSKITTRTVVKIGIIDCRRPVTANPAFLTDAKNRVYENPMDVIPAKNRDTKGTAREIWGCCPPNR